MKLRPIILIIVFVVFAQELFAQQKSRYEKAADSLMQSGQSAKVIPYLNKELKGNPRSEPLLRLLGFYHLQNENLIDGERYYRDALAVNPKCARCYLNIARIYAFKNNEKEALAYVEKGVAMDPKDALIVSNRAKIKEQFGDKFGALTDHNKAIEMAPDHAEYYTERGGANAKNGYESLALNDFNKAIALSPDSYDAYFYRGGIFYNQQRIDEALSDINKAISLNGKIPHFYNGRGAIYASLGQFDKALSDYSESIKLNPKAVIAYLNRAKVYYDLENLDAACDDYTKAKQISLSQHVKDNDELKSINESITDFCDPSQSSYFYQRGIAHYNLKQYEQSLVQYDKGLQKFPNNAMILSFKGNTLLAMNNYKSALENYEAALRNQDKLKSEIKANSRFTNATEAEFAAYYNASLAAIYFGIAESQNYLGRFEEALAAINTAISLAPNTNEINKETYFHRRGTIYLATAKYSLALIDFNKSIEIKNDYALAYANRAIARISLIEGGKKTAYRLSAKLPNQPTAIGWVFNDQALSKRSEKEFLLALADCDKAIILDQNFAFPYYIRGWIKQILGQKDFCVDILMAKKLGLEVDAAMLKNCNQ